MNLNAFKKQSPNIKCIFFIREQFHFYDLVILYTSLILMLPPTGELGLDHVDRWVEN